MSEGGPTRKREQKLQPGLLEPCALKGARTVLRGGAVATLPRYPTNNFFDEGCYKKNPRTGRFGTGIFGVLSDFKEPHYPRMG